MLPHNEGNLPFKDLLAIQDDIQEIYNKEGEAISKVAQEYHVIRKPVYDKRSDIIKSIPDFWTVALMSHRDLSKLLDAVDKEIFKHLTSLEVEHHIDASCSVTFNFAPNFYFEDAKITMPFTYNDDGLKSIIGTPSVKWKEGMDGTNGVPYSFLSQPIEAQQFNYRYKVIKAIVKDVWINPLAYLELENRNDGSESEDE